MKRAKTRAVRRKEGKEMERKRKKCLFNTSSATEKCCFSNLASLPISLHYHPGGVYIGWVEISDGDGAIELTLVDEFI